MKTCRQCGERKAAKDYYKHPAMADGRLNICVVCVKARVRLRHHALMKDPLWRESERDRGRKKAVNNQNRSPRVRAAGSAVSNALRDGRMFRPTACDDCGHDFTEFRREAHHTDYDKPLDVEWLCSLCHGKRHRRYA